ncbi:MAG: hypothetical protein LUF35_11395 [Lachnospiraceae bacterium]|nr:hypothetical protein [Lachnospiraceae bacterium]
MNNSQKSGIFRRDLISRVVYALWTAAFCIILIACSLEKSPILIDGTVRTTCFGLFGMLILLGLLTLLCGDETPAYKKMLAGSGMPVPVKYVADGSRAEQVPHWKAIFSALRQPAAMILAAVVYWCYCFRLDGVISTNSKIDALVAGGLICAAVTGHTRAKAVQDAEI